MAEEIKINNPAVAAIDLGKVENITPIKPKKPKISITLKNTLGEDVSQRDYFWSIVGEDTAPVYFNRVCGLPVTREDMLSVFHKIFKPEYGILFYKVENKEVYVIIPPIRYSPTLGNFNDSRDGDFQKHAISFVGEGSVNLDTLKLKLQKIAKYINIQS